MTSKKLLKNNRLQYGGAVQEGTNIQQDIEKNVTAYFSNLKKHKSSLDSFNEKKSGNFNVFIVVDMQNGFTTGGSLAANLAQAPLSLNLMQSDLITYQYTHFPYECTIFSKDFHPPDHSSFDKNGGPYQSHCRDPYLSALANPSKYSNNIRVEDVIKAFTNTNFSINNAKVSDVDAAVNTALLENYDIQNNNDIVVGPDISYLLSWLNRQDYNMSDDMFSSKAKKWVAYIKSIMYPNSVNPKEARTVEARTTFLNMHVGKTTNLSTSMPDKLKEFSSWTQDDIVCVLKGQSKELDANSVFLNHIQDNRQIAYQKENLLGTWWAVAMGFLSYLKKENLINENDLNSLTGTNTNYADEDKVATFNTKEVVLKYNKYIPIPIVVVDVCGLVTNICVAQSLSQGIIAWLYRYHLCIPKIHFNVLLRLSVPYFIPVSDDLNHFDPYNINFLNKSQDETDALAPAFFINALARAISLNNLTATDKEIISANVSISIVGTDIVNIDIGDVMKNVDTLTTSVFSTSAVKNIINSVMESIVQAPKPVQGGGSQHNSTCNCNQCNATYKNKYLKYKKKYLAYKYLEYK